jgi:hypothetical protein
LAQIVLVTGMSGAGRTTALKALEDIGFEAVDNLPVTLLGSLIRPGDRLERDLAIRSCCSWTAKTRSCAAASTRRGGGIRSPSTAPSPTASPLNVRSWPGCVNMPIW